MGVVAIPNTFSNGSIFDAPQVNTNFSTIYNEFNGNIDNANIKSGANIDAAKLLNASVLTAKIADLAITDAKLEYASVKVLRIGPTHPGGNGLRVARGGKAFTYAAGVVSITITFSTDSDDGNPVFSAAPRLVGTIEGGSTTTVNGYRITSRLASAVVVEIRETSGASAASGTFHWVAIGTV